MRFPSKWDTDTESCKKSQFSFSYSLGKLFVKICAEMGRQSELISILSTEQNIWHQEWFHDANKESQMLFDATWWMTETRILVELKVSQQTM